MGNRMRKSSHTEILIVELADVGPGFAWAEPCSRGCMQLLMKHGVRQGWWTDGKGGLVTRPFRHEPGLDVAAATFEGPAQKGILIDMFSQEVGIIFILYIYIYYNNARI